MGCGGVAVGPGEGAGRSAKSGVPLGRNHRTGPAAGTIRRLDLRIRRIGGAAAGRRGYGLSAASAWPADGASPRTGARGRVSGRAFARRSNRSVHCPVAGRARSRPATSGPRTRRPVRSPRAPDQAVPVAPEPPKPARGYSADRINEVSGSVPLRMAGVCAGTVDSGCRPTGRAGATRGSLAAAAVGRHLCTGMRTELRHRLPAYPADRQGALLPAAVPQVLKRHLRDGGSSACPGTPHPPTTTGGGAIHGAGGPPPTGRREGASRKPARGRSLRRVRGRPHPGGLRTVAAHATAAYLSAAYGPAPGSR